MKVISFVNQKGGVAKTTSCHNVAAYLARLKKKCLLIDIDPQGSLTISAGLRNLPSDELTTYEILLGADTNKAIITRQTEYSYDILPTDGRLSAYEEKDQYNLKKAIEKIKAQYDFILIDCPPTLGRLTVTALTASDLVIAPVSTQYLALTGIAQLVKTIQAVKDSLNPNIELLGIIATFYNSRRSHDNEVVESLKEAFPDILFKTILTSNSKVAEAPSYGKNIFEYSPKCKGAIQYKELTEEFLKRI